jgi:hypothetical protein
MYASHADSSLLNRFRMVNSTLEDLTRYMYNELPPQQQARIESELQNNWALREKYSVLKESFKRLERMKLQSPRQQSVNAILKYAKKPTEVSS